MKQARAILISKKIVAPDVFHLFFNIEDGSLEFSPGQYIILSVPNGASTTVKRLYSFAGSNKDKDVFELLIKLVPGGVASEFMRNLSVGGAIDVSGPAGLFLEQKTPARKIYMATGTGFAPIRSFITSHPENTLNSVLFWGLKDLSETYMFEELLLIKNSNPLFSFYYCLSQQDSFDGIPAKLLHYFRTGHIDAVWATTLPSINAEDEYYLCGSRTVIESLRLLLLSKGVSKDKLFFEKY
jgi:ferredoxin-NADP reductase